MLQMCEGLVCVLLVTCLTVGLASGAEPWDHFVFAQSWPPGTCADAPREHHTCNIGKDVETWTIHGLWPSLGDTKGPLECNKSWPFDFSKIASLQSQLMIYWPNLYNDTPLNSFWEHEWDKHGTCCTDLDATAGEHNYFATGLMMNKKYNLSQILRQSNIIPSDTIQYGYDDFVGAIKNATGFEPILQCTTQEQYDSTGKKSTYHLIDQIQICLDKTFVPISCYNISSTAIHNSLKSKNDSLLSFEQGEENDLIGRKRSSNLLMELDMKIQSIIRRSHHHQTETLKYIAHESGTQSTCPKKYKFNYPPIHHF